MSAGSVLQALPAGWQALLFGLDRHDRWLSARDSRALLLSAGLDAASVDARLAPEPPAPPAERWGPRRGLAGADVLFPLVHGDVGEDGTLQGLLELLDVPYVGSGVATSAVGLDKCFMKAAFAAAGLPVVPYLVTTAREATDEATLTARVEALLRYPVFVKAANAGSSVGVDKVASRAELLPAVRMALGFDRRVVIEQGIQAREVEVAVLGAAGALAASVPGEVVPKKDWYDYESKYTPGLADLVIPADLPPALSDQVRRLAIEAADALGVEGLARVDFFLEAGTQRLWLNEINTLPGFTATSMYPILWGASGLGYGELIARLLDLARARHAARGEPFA